MKISNEFNDNAITLKLTPESPLEVATMNEMQAFASKGAALSLTKKDNEYCFAIKTNGKQ